MPNLTKTLNVDWKLQRQQITENYTIYKLGPDELDWKLAGFSPFENEDL